jgi:DNA-binding response OmpR family regulator
MEASTPSTTRSGLILVDDLMFASQIQGLARTVNFQLLWVRSIQNAVAQTAATQPAVVVLDVNFVGVKIGELVASLKSTAAATPTIIGFGSHVDAASLHQARAVGCDVVLPRSKFVQDIAGILRDQVEKKSS